MSDINYYKKYLKYKEKYLNLKKMIGGNPPHCCEPEELMTNLNYETECTNVISVVGSCGEPSFGFGLTFELSEEHFLKLKNIFKFCSENEQITNIHIILGATENLKSDFNDNQNEKSIYLFFDPVNPNYIDTIENLSKYPSIKLFKFNLSFPLNHLEEKSKQILELIIEINKNKPIYITNRMCGTCHRSLYYLVNNGIKYIVNPEQNLSDELDTDEVRNCFNKNKYTYKTCGKKIVKTKKNGDGEEEGEIWALPPNKKGKF